ncbi:hypothetical protein ASALC70_03496 [Alcanivorax sp. ALC70]|jgi:hypothetical protein|nr:hypothetical protein ASALC70_03496 [Alcanivorax sp. ALC70]|tara:strand:+ start:414 stop:614 length:201 start_codon:yes stop_codon:yes gene_type:complete
MDPEKILNGLSKEIEAALKEMGKAKGPEERRMHSDIVKNLCESLGVLLSSISDMALLDDDDDPIPF